MADNVSPTESHVTPSGSQMEAISIDESSQQLQHGLPPPIGFKLDEKPPPYPGLPMTGSYGHQLISTTGYPQPPPAYPGFPDHHNIVMQQPGLSTCQQLPGTQVVIAERQYPPPTQMCLSCTVFWFCCFPLGLVALVYSCMVQNRYSTGDYEGAVSASRCARVWGNLGFFIGLCIWTLVFILLFM